MLDWALTLVLQELRCKIEHPVGPRATLFSRRQPFTANITLHRCSSRTYGGSLPFSKVLVVKIVTWLILPVVICLSQRLSHACLSISKSIQ